MRVGASLSVCTLAAITPSLLALPLRAQYPGVPPPPPCTAGSPNASEPRTHRATDRGLAVLGFVNVSGDPADAYLAEALTDGLTSRLRNIARLQVRSHRPAPDLTPPLPEDAVALGRTLGVRYVVTGTTERTHSGVGVTVRVDKVQDGARVWSTRYASRSVSGLATLQDTIAHDIASHSAGKLSRMERSALTGQRVRNPEAYDHYLRGNYHLARRTPEAVALAIDEYRVAIRVNPAVVDPSFGKALTRLATSYAVLVQSGWHYQRLSREAMLSRAWSAIERALESEPRSADVWLARASLLELRNPRTFSGVKAAYERAVSLEPRNAEAHHRYGSVLMQLGEHEAASAQLRRALALEPDRADALVDLAELSFYKRQYREACRLLNAAIRTDPRVSRAYALRARVRLQIDEVRDAWADAETAARLGSRLLGESVSALVEVHARDSSAARTRMSRLSRDWSVRSRQLTVGNARYVALALAAIGERRQALEVLERVQPRGAALWAALQDPGFGQLRWERRFQRLLKESRPTSLALRSRPDFSPGTAGVFQS